jgi:16S rRNA (guanine527-N7)-methyltransferase
MSASESRPRVSRETLAAFEDLLRRWNRRINLISRADELHIWDRHVEDSAQLAPLIPARVTRAVDLGSGAGFPGLILAAETGIAFDLIEADRRKAIFLREAARVLRAPVRVHAVRIESADLPLAPLVTARAVAPLPKLLDWAARFLTPDGVCLFLKGVGVDSELTAAAAEWQMRVQRFPSRTAAGGVILRISGLQRANRPA